MKLSKGWIILIVVIGIIFLLIAWITGINNKLVTKEEVVNQQWANVENVYQRRLDLIPNLVNTVKGVANFEQQTLTAVIEARAKATSVQINPKNLDEGSLQKFQEAQNGVSSALGRLMVVVEKYPELKATQNFLELQAQLEGTENRITVERMKFNEAAQAFNTYLRKFPNSIFAGMFGFSKKAYFQAQAGAEKAPEVKF
ncbi:MAG: LemA family protein [Bacteroidales bacterium]|mgnify:CR=1 FL=1|nr:LemA family protein [Bacteroidales bacterium]NCA75392.1 LemA family protein [Alphaproteobacteria bacterium]HNW73787.1 LemA family protein [Bacteroidales bacterium]HPS50511.1 LemA family protein [Bacteroidales bacterium]